jgi:hypothetical protein
MVPLCREVRTTNIRKRKKKKKKEEITDHHPTPNRMRDFLLTLKYTTKAGAHNVPQVLASLSTLGYYIL